MKRLLCLSFLIAVSLVFSGCVAIHSSSFSNVEAGGGTGYTAQAEAMGILSVTVPEIHDLEDRALNGLKQNGATKNIRVRLEMRNFFVVQMYKVIAIGEK